MKFSNIRPFVRFARFQTIVEKKHQCPMMPRDHRLFYVLKGTAQILLDNQITELSKGDLIIIPSGTVYQHLNTEVEYIAFNFDYTDEFKELIAPIYPNSQKGISNKPVLENFLFEDEKIFNNILVVNDCSELQRTLIKIVDIYNNPLSYSNLQASVLFTNVLIESLRKHNNNNNNNNCKFSRIIQYIQQHYSEPITNITLGEIFNYHPNYLSAEFKRQTGKTLHNYILEFRISKAVNIIEDGEKDLSIIASSVGFSDYNYFSRYFKKILKITPRKYITTIHNKS